MYADDLVLFSPTPTGLQKLIDECSNYGRNFDINYNPKKSMVMKILTQQEKNLVFSQFLLGSLALPQTSCIKYLGHYISDDLSDDKDIGRQRNYLYVRGNIIMRNFCRCSEHVKVMLFKTYCFNMYTPQLWCEFKRISFQSFITAYNQAFRMIMGYPSYFRARFIFVYNHVYSCGEILRKIIYRFRKYLTFSENSVVSNVNSILCTSSLSYHWRNMLYNS